MLEPSTTLSVRLTCIAQADWEVLAWREGSDRPVYAADGHETPSAGLRGLERALCAESGHDGCRDEHRAFVEALTQALSDHGVPAMPSWREAIDWLATHGGAASREDCDA